jgi:cysteine desulfurase
MTNSAGNYFDNNATTAIAPECLEAMQACLQLGPLNASSKHRQGEVAKQLIMEARGKVAKFLGATPPELVFTSGGTESNHLAILSTLALQPERAERRHIITSEVEHPSTLTLLRQLENHGVRVTYLPVHSDGQLSLEALQDTLTTQTALISLLWANNETGVLFPIESISAIARAKGVLLHVDAVQAVGRLPINLAQQSIDLLSVSGHKLHAPAGIGALYVRKGIRLPAQLHGHQERGRRGGTENVAGIVALGVACELLQNQLQQRMTYIGGLRDAFEAGVLASIPSASINGSGAERVGNTSNIRFGDLDAELLLDRLDRLGFFASAGAACASTGTKPSHVLTAMGLNASAALASLRFSLGINNTRAEVDALLTVLPEVVQELSRMTA